MHTGGFGWKSKKSGQVIAISKGDLKQVEWLKIPHAYQLKLRIKGGFVYMFNGLKNQARPPGIALLPIAAPPACPRGAGSGAHAEGKGGEGRGGEVQECYR